jgi:hypothetical protein
MTDTPVNLDHHRGMSARKATDTNETLHASLLFYQSNDGCQLSKKARACPSHHRS